MAILSVEDLPIEGKRVFLRVDFNVPLEGGEVSDDARIRGALPTIRHCIERGARLVLASHLGRPKGEVKPEYSLEPVARRLAELLDQEVRLTDEPAGDGARKVVADLREGQIAMLENLRFHPGEEKNDEHFAKALASYADVYISDAFGAAHRAHASTVGMVPFVAEKGAGLLMRKEIEFLSMLLGEVARPYVAVLGGAKVSDKIEVLEALAERVDTILIGGAMANTFLVAKGQKLGRSKIEEEKLGTARGFLKRAADKGVLVRLPTDVVIAEGLDAPSGSRASVEAVPEDAMALDIGPDSAKAYAEELERARTVFWNGPMGVFEREPFAAGTLAVARAVADNRLATTVIGGGDSVAAAAQAGVTDRISHVSTGGGASLEYIQGLTLPGIAALEA
jgi:phosphoglycerate kinase